MNRWLKRMLFFCSFMFLGLTSVEVNSQEETFSESTDIEEQIISIGNSSLQGNYTTGTNGQGIVSIVYRYTPLLSAAIGDNPVIAIKLPTEVTSQLVTSTKQQQFLSLLTGTVTYPAGLSNTTVNIKDTTKGFTLNYDATKGLVYVVFPRSTGLLLLTNRWEVNVSFDVGELYKKDIRIPPANNGSNYPIAGDFTDMGTGINIVTGNSKTGVINAPTMSIGNLPVLTTPTITGNLQHLQSAVSGNIQQTKVSGYTYTVQLQLTHTDGTATPIILSNIPVDAAGNFTVALTGAAVLEYGDQVSARVVATSATDTFQSAFSTAKGVAWAITPVRNAGATAGTSQITGTAIQAQSGTYQIRTQINGGSPSTTSLNADGTFRLSNLATFTGGEQISLWVQGVSSRTGNILLQSSEFKVTVPYLAPQLNVTNLLEKQTAAGNWESAASAVTGQKIRYTTTITLNNQAATWKNQTFTLNIPVGLTQLSDALLTRQSSSGANTALTGVQLLTDNGTGQQYWSYRNTADENNFTQQNTKLIFQYTAIVGANLADRTLSFTGSVGGTDGGNQAITPIPISQTLLIKNGTLRFVNVPNRFSYQNLPVPSKPKLYQATTVDSALMVADGRVTKTQWRLYLSEAQALRSTTSTKVIRQAFIYQKAGVSIPINEAPNEVYSYTAPDENAVSISWDQNNGVFLNLQPDNNLDVRETYAGQLRWTLTDAPL